MPSHVYQYSFAGNPNWSKFYAGGAEIQEYLKDICWRYDVEKYVRLKHHFEKADWNEETQKWTVTVKCLQTNRVRIKDPSIFQSIVRDHCLLVGRIECGF